MGILRTDRVSGLGGANAITGSVRFHGNQDDLQLDPNSDFNLGTGDYTIEAWFYPVEFGRSQMIFAVSDSDSAAATGKFYFRSTNKFTYWSENAVRITSSTTYTESKWYHVALVNNSGTQTIYVDGTSQGTSTYGNGFGSDTFEVSIGRNPAGTTQSMNGYISNIRVTKGTALYTGTFTPPTTRLTKRSDTVLLACNSASNVLNEETGKTIQSVRASTNNSGAKSSRFTPNSPVGSSTTTDVGTQFGSTFDGVTTFDSQAYMVPPGGNTRERNRGRGLILGGSTGSPSTNTDIIKYFDVASQGITETFGNLTDPDGNGRRSLASVSSSTRACTGGGYSHGGSPGTVKNIIDFVTIANTGNATDFGDMQNTAYAYAPASNQTRGLFAGGYQPNNSTVVNTIDLITISTTGNASNFGDLTVRRRALAGLESTTRGVFAGGTFPAVHDEIDFVTFSTTGNATDFGDLTDARDNVRASSNSTRGVMGGGRDPSNTNIIDFITIASAGNAIDFGDLLSAKFYYAATGNKTRAVWAGDDSGTNAMEFVTIATTGNAVDFGDQNGTPQQLNGCASDSHGGLE